MIEEIIYKTYLLLMTAIRTNGTVHQHLFGYRPCHGSETYGGYWDWTTIIIKKALQQYLRADHKFLDMGTGSVGVLAMFAKLQKGCKAVYAVDHLPDILALAKKNADFLDLSISFRQSDLFCNISECFDVISFNAPYLDIDTARSRGIVNDRLSERRFSGGHGGGKTIARFLLDAPRHLTSGGILVLGVNHYHISRRTVQDLILNSVFVLHACVESRFIPSSAYVLRQNRDQRDRKNDR